MHTEIQTETDPCTGLTQKSCRHKSGLAIRVTEMPAYHTAAAQLGVRYGAVDRRFSFGGKTYDTPAGTAHYLEHMMFTTERINAPARFAALGAAFNAETSFDTTVYYFQTAQHFQESLAVLLDLIQHPLFTGERTRHERSIILPEINGDLSDAELQVSLAAIQTLFPQAFAVPEIAGSPQSIRHITPALLTLCHRAHYTLSNMVLCCAGDLCTEEVLATADRMLDILPGETARPLLLPEPDTPPQRETEVPLPYAGNEFVIGWRSPAVQGAGAEREYRLCELALMALTGAGSPFYAEMLEKNLLTEPLYCETLETAAGFGIMAGGVSADPRAVRDALLAEIGKCRAAGLDPALFENTRRAEYSYSVQRTAAPEDAAAAMLRCWQTQLSSPFAYTEMVSGFTAAEAAEVLLRRLRPDFCTLAAAKESAE